MYVLFPKLRGEMVWRDARILRLDEPPERVGRGAAAEKRLSITLARKVAHQVREARERLRAGARVCSFERGARRPPTTAGARRAPPVLHARGIMHRNLTGQAVLLSRGGKAQVAILDLAREVARATARRSRRGPSLARRSPRVPAHARRYGSEADVYSVGMLLVMMLGRR